MDESANKSINWFIKQKKELEVVSFLNIPIKEDVLYAKDQKLIEIARISLLMQNICLKENGVGLSAVQLGIPYKIFIAKNYDISNEFYTFVDCQYEGIGDKKTSIEGCLSLKNKSNQVKRYKLDRFPSVILKGLYFSFENNMNLVPFEKQYDGFFSSILQHEIDHQNGILISDIGKEMDLY
jgi:peptide deformylase